MSALAVVRDLRDHFGLDEKTAMRCADSARCLLETSAESLNAEDLVGRRLLRVTTSWHHYQ